MLQKSKLIANKDQSRFNMKLQLSRFKIIASSMVYSNQFWLGYFAARILPIFSQPSKKLNEDSWKQLTETIQLIITLSQQKIISAQNVFELFVFALQSEDSQKNKETNIDRIRQCLQTCLNQVAQNNSYLKDKYFSEENQILYKNKEPSILVKSKNIQTKKQQIQSKHIKSEELGIQCPICLSQVTLQNVCPVSCGHNLHQSCLIEHFKSKVQTKKFPICCPEDGCNFEIVIQDLQQYIPSQLLEKYYQFCLHEFVDKNKKNTNWCPTPGCSAVFSYDGQLAQYRCLACKKNYCLKCKTESHTGMTCQINRAKQNLPEEEKQFIKFAQGAKMKQCPSCLFWVEKNKGCDHMTCRCGYEFCFRCGAKYGQGDCNCDERDSFYGHDDDDDDEDVDVRSEGLDFEDQIEYPEQSGRRSSFIPNRAQQRVQRINRLVRQRVERQRIIRERVQGQEQMRRPEVRRRQEPPSIFERSSSFNWLPDWISPNSKQKQIIIPAINTYEQRRRRIPFHRSKSMHTEDDDDDDDDDEEDWLQMDREKLPKRK